jgi:hypothetical protein
MEPSGITWNEAFPERAPEGRLWKHLYQSFQISKKKKKITGSIADTQGNAFIST